MIQNLNSRSTVIYFQGTFDPAHQGHASALEAAMTKTNAAGAVVVVGDEPNPDKPDRSLIEIRREIARRNFAHLANVLVSDASQRETKRTLFEHNRVIALIGSDACPLYANRDKVRFDGFCVNLREQADSFNHPLLAGKEAVCVVPAVQGCSSSQIKSYLQSHPEIYEGGQIEPGTILDQLTPSARDFIVQNKLYYRSIENYAQQLKNNIEQLVSERVFQGKSCACTCLTQSFSKNKKESGRSGDLTFSVACEDKKVFIKAYIRESHPMDCESERGGMELLGRLSLSWAKALSPIYTQIKIRESLVVVPYLDFPDVAKVFKSVNDPASIKQLIDACFCVGRALSELHHQRFYPIKEVGIREETRDLNERTLARLKKFSPNLEKEFGAIFASSYEEYLKNPGVHTYVHGDADLSNFVVDESGVVTFLDLGRLCTKRTSEGDPLGCPGEDYYRFMKGLSWFNFWLNEEGNVSSSVVDSAQAAFEQGYATFPSMITKEAHRYFSNYWAIKSYKFEQRPPR